MAACFLDAGHADYQGAYLHERALSMDGLGAAVAELKDLQGTAAKWQRRVKDSRDRFFFLNYYTMREVLKIRDVVLSSEKPGAALVAEGAALAEGEKATATDAAAASAAVAAAVASAAAAEADAAAAAAAAVVAEAENPSVEMIVSMGFPADHAAAALRRCGENVEEAIEFLFSHSQHMDRIVAEDLQAGLGGGGSGGGGGAGAGGGRTDAASAAARAAVAAAAGPADPTAEFISLMYAASSTVDEAAVPGVMAGLRLRLAAGEELLVALGSALDELFGATPEAAAAKVCERLLPVPGSTALNRADMLISIDDDDGKKALPLFVAATAEGEAVIDVVLSVFVRRGRLPEPGEVLFATALTTSEELELMVRRWLTAGRRGRSKSVFTVADLHVLSYTQQCGFVDRLRVLLADLGTEHAATLLLVSGKSKQVALNQLSEHHVDLPPLELSELRKACSEAFGRHVGSTECVASVVNGGGKSHTILRRVAVRQAAGEPTLYARVPMRESTTPAALVDLLAKATARCRASDPSCSTTVHLDIAHIIPASANTMLFELLLVGCLCDSTNCRIFHRRKSDGFQIELPNSPDDKSSKALRFCSLLPTTVLVCEPKEMDLTRPAFSDAPLCSRVVLPAYTEATYVSKFVRAFRTQVFNPRSQSAYNASFDPYSDSDITAEECFEHLTWACNAPDGPAPAPSFAAFRQFALFMNEQFNHVSAYPLLDGNTLAMLGGGWPFFKHAFIHMSIETAKDFGLRSVAQVSKVGPPPPPKAAKGAASLRDHEATAAGGGGAVGGGGGGGSGAAGGGGGGGDAAEGGDDFVDDFDDFDEDDMPPVPAPLLKRSSSSATDEHHQVQAAAPLTLTRQTTLEMAARFGGMRSWESSDHPVVLFRLDPRTTEVDGVDLLSLNQSYVDQYIDRALRQELETQNIDFGKDWSKITNEEGAKWLRSVEGLRSEGGRGGVGAMDEGYVLTIDNLLKMISIQLRLKYQLPVVIMGETGCGKSSLIRNLCGIIGAVLRTLNIHGGMDDATIVAWMQAEVDRASNMTDRIIVFLDEVNTCNCMGLFKEIVVSSLVFDLI